MPPLFRAVLLCLVAIRVIGEAVSSIVAQQVLSEIGKIARSDCPLQKRREEATTRINQFKADLAAQVQPRQADQQKESLRRTLQRAAMDHSIAAEATSVYGEALDALMGGAG
jgi:hypothetical protein